MAATSPSLALPRNEARRAAKLDAPGIIAWLPLVSVLVGIVSLLYLAQTSELTTTGYSIQELQVQESNWMLRNEQLSLELSKAKSLAVVGAEATGRLNMVRPEKLVYLELPAAEAGDRAIASSRGADQRAAQLSKSGRSVQGGEFAPADGPGILPAARPTTPVGKTWPRRFTAGVNTTCRDGPNRRRARPMGAGGEPAPPRNGDTDSNGRRNPRPPVAAHSALHSLRGLRSRPGAENLSLPGGGVPAIQ